MAIQLTTFGGLRVAGDTGELDRMLTQHSRAALFVYMAVERRVSRESLTAMFWPESDAANARHALRQSLYHLRKAIGDGEWIRSGAHELIVRHDIRTDANDFTDALERGDNDSAVRLYRGPFLAGVHLVDLSSWESWVDARRAQYARAFRKACRELLDARRATGDLAGAIETAERWTACTPADEEAQHRLIEALAAAGERAEAIRQYETYVRLAEADEMQPLVETRQLVERLQSDASPLPALRTAPLDMRQPAHPAPAAQPVEPVESQEPATHGMPRRWPVAAGAMLLIALLATVWVLRSTLLAGPPAPAATAIAVFPFSVRGGESVQYLSAGMVNLLGTALDGAGSLRPVDTRATFAAVTEAGGAVPDARHADRIATRLNAMKFVLGDVVEAGGMLQLEAAVYVVGTVQPQGRAVVSGPADSLFGLVDRLAARLLGELGDRSADRLLQTAALTTSSLPALKVYLQGEKLMRAAQFERAADAYLAALALDSTFAVAHYRLALAREWAPLPGNADAASAAARHGARLSARDRMLLEAFRQWRTGDAVRALHSYQTILARYPDDVDAWYQLGEIQFHHGQLLGHPFEESEAAWRTVLSYEPRNLFALTHLARIAAVDGRASALDSLLQTFRRFEPAPARTDRRFEELLILRAVTRGDTSAALASARELRRGESFAIWRIAVFLTAFSPDIGLMRRVIQELIEDYPNPGLRADLYWFTSALDLAGGRARAARAALANAATSERTVPAEQRRGAYEAVTEWFVATLPLPYAESELAGIRRRAAAAQGLPARLGSVFVSELDLGASLQFEPLRQYTLGLLSLRLRDTAAGTAAADQLARLAASRDASPLVRDLDRGLRARLAWVAGRPDESLRLLDALEYRDTQGDVAATPFTSRANERFLHGEVLISMGRDADALKWFASLGYGAVSEIPLRAPAHLRQAEIHERLGNRDEAARHYDRFLKLWGDADQEFRPQVDAVRQRRARLAHSPGD